MDQTVIDALKAFAHDYNADPRGAAQRLEDALSADTAQQADEQALAAKQLATEEKQAQADQAAEEARFREQEAARQREQAALKPAPDSPDTTPVAGLNRLPPA